MAGTFGVIPLCVHTIAYQLIPLLFMVPLGISIGMSIRIGTVLAHDVEKAKTIAKYSVALTCVVAVCMSTLLYKLKRPIVLLFTSDAEVIKVSTVYFILTTLSTFFLPNSMNA
jgi:MATE family multidrug resistance protein